MLRPRFKKAERKIIRKIAKMQMEAMAMALRGEYDVTLHCLKEDLDEQQIREFIQKNYDVFENLYNNPNDFFELDEDNMSISKHILFRQFKNEKYLEGKEAIWAKLILTDNFLHKLN